MLNRRQVLGSMGSLAIAAAARPLRAAPADRPLRVVLNVGLQILDPITSPSFVTRNFAYMVWDTLVGIDSQGNYKPQMLESWQSSEDHRSWQFKLRPGLLWSDRTPVTAADCVASIKRWGQRDSVGRRLMAATANLAATADDRFTLELSRPFGRVIEALGKPSVQVPFMMPARIAATPPTQPIREILGSGPFTFAAEEWRPGEKTVFRRNPHYRPRDEPADGLAGGKVAKFEQIEFLTMSDPGTRYAALQQGEVDYLEYAPFDFIPDMQRNRSLVLGHGSPIGQIRGGLSLNHTQPPFDNVAVRRAVQQALDPAEIIAAYGLPADMRDDHCLSLYMCGTRFASDSGTDALREPSLERAKALLQQSGYTNERVVFLLPTDSALINPIGLVMIDRLKRTGFNLDVQSADWSSIASRWVTRNPLDRGGWSAVPVIYTGFDLQDPLVHVGLGYNCTGNTPWSYCDAEITPLLQAFEAESDPVRQKQLAAEIQAKAIAFITFPLAGQFTAPPVWRSDLQGVVDFGLPVFWNVERAKT